MPAATPRSPLCCHAVVPQVFDLGSSGSEPAKKVAELTDFLGEVARLPTGRNVFTLGEDKRGTAIKYLAVVRECLAVHSVHRLPGTAAG